MRDSAKYDLCLTCWTLSRFPVRTIQSQKFKPKKYKQLY